MEFLTIFSLYLLLCGIIFTLYMFKDTSFLSTGLIGSFRTLSCQIIAKGYASVPVTVRRRLGRFCDHIFFERNPIFQVLYMILVMSGHCIVLVDVLPHLYAIVPHSDQVSWTMILFLVNGILFVICCRSDPGIISKHSHIRYINIYPYDNVMYKKDNPCRTCHFKKPARSKHCAISDKCIYKFDHYCTWINNAVGGLNHRYFVGFLVSTCLMCINGTTLSLRSLMSIIHTHQLWKLHFMDSQGQIQPVSFTVLFQTLFMQFPRVVFLATALFAVSLVVSIFTCYHLILVASNQTTNERYKKYYLKLQRQAAHPNSLYDKGIWNNIMEELRPLSERKPKRFSKHKTK